MDKKTWQLVTLVLLIVCISYPVLFMDVATGHDLDFHLMRIEGLFSDLSLTNFPVRIQSKWLDGYGYPVSILYGDIFLYIGALFRIAGFSVINAYRAFIVFVNSATVIISYYSFRTIFKNKTVAFLCSVLYSTAAYRLVDEYVRAAIGETIAIVFFPAVAATVYLILTGEDRNKRFRAAVILAFVVTSVICSHTLTTSMMIFVLIPVCIICLFLFCKKGERFARFIDFSAAGIMAALMAAFFIIPFLDYYLTSDIELASNDDMSIQKVGIHLSDLFAFFADPFHLDIGEVKIQKTPGIALMAVLICAIIYFVFSIVKKSYFRHHRRILFEMICATVMIFMAMHVFPWDFIEYNVPFGKILTAIEYPMRYLAFAILFITLLAGDLFVGLYEKLGTTDTIKGNRIIVITMAAVCIMGVFNVANLSVYNEKYEFKTDYKTEEDIGRWEYYAMDFVLEHVTIDDLPLEISTEGMVSMEVLSREHNDFLIACVTGPEYGWIQLPVFNYKYFYAHDVADPSKVFEIHDGANRTVGVLLPADYTGIIHVYMREPLWWKIAKYISLVSVLLGLVYLVLSSPLHTRRLSRNN